MGAIQSKHSSEPDIFISAASCPNFLIKLDDFPWLASAKSSQRCSSHSVNRAGSCSSEIRVFQQADVAVVCLLGLNIKKKTKQQQQKMFLDAECLDQNSKWSVTLICDRNTAKRINKNVLTLGVKLGRFWTGFRTSVGHLVPHLRRAEAT